MLLTFRYNFCSNVSDTLLVGGPPTCETGAASILVLVTGKRLKIPIVVSSRFAVLSCVVLCCVVLCCVVVSCEGVA